MASPPELLVSGPTNARHSLALAHGAGAAMDSEFMDVFARGLADFDIRVVWFEFPYMAERRKSGKHRPPDREPILRETWLSVIRSLKVSNLVIGGKSMGGRIASLITDEVGAAGLVCLGYPFHPVGKPAQLRIEHLKTIQTSTLIVQGERDTFGTRAEVSDYRLSKNVQLHWLLDGETQF